MIFSFNLRGHHFECREEPYGLVLETYIGGWVVQLTVPYDNPTSLLNDEELVKSWVASTGIPLTKTLTYLIHKYKTMKERQEKRTNVYKRHG